MANKQQQIRPPPDGAVFLKEFARPPYHVGHGESQGDNDKDSTNGNGKGHKGGDACENSSQLYGRKR